MKTGASVSDSEGTTWTLGQELGRGPCARTYVARSADGREAALSISHTAADFRAQADALAAVCVSALQEQARWYKGGRRTWLPELIDTFEHEGRQVLLTPRPTATLASRIKAGAPLLALLDVLLSVSVQLATGNHGHLLPEVIHLFDDGSTRMIGPITPAMEEALPRLLDNLNQPLPRVLPPESQGQVSAVSDTYAICLALYRAGSVAPAGADGRRQEPPPLPDGGLDKVALSAVKDRVHARLQQERANPRFSMRVADKLGAVLNRGLSRQPAPSPPYRFGRTSELTGRLREIRDLIDPRVEAVGKVLLSPTARDAMFEGGEVAAFSTTVTVTAGADHEDLATGLLVRDLDADGDDRVPVPDAKYAVKPHPSGRLRFDFELPELRPGRYTVRIAFTVKDSGHEPMTTDGHFEIRPPPGYVPPADEPAPEAQALRFPGAGVPSSAGRGIADHDPDEPGYDDSDPFADGDDDALGADAFPSPIAPSDPGTSPGIRTRDDLDAPPPVFEAQPTPPTVPHRRPSPALPPGIAAVSTSPGTPVPRLGIAPSTDPEGPGTDPTIPPGQRSAPGLAPIPSIRPSDAGPRDSDPGADITREAPSTGWGASAGQWEDELPGVDDPIPPQRRTAGAGGAGAGGAGGGTAGGRADFGYDGPGSYDSPNLHLGLDQPSGGLLPTPEGMEDLPGFDDPKPDAVSALIEQVTTFLRENAMVALVIVVGVLVLFLVLAGLIFQALAG